MHALVICNQATGISGGFDFCAFTVNLAESNALQELSVDKTSNVPPVFCYVYMKLHFFLAYLSDTNPMYFRRKAETVRRVTGQC